MRSGGSVHGLRREWRFSWAGRDQWISLSNPKKISGTEWTRSRDVTAKKYPLSTHTFQEWSTGARGGCNHLS